MVTFTITKVYRTTITYVVNAESAEKALYSVEHDHLGGTINGHLDTIQITSSHDFTLRAAEVANIEHVTRAPDEPSDIVGYPESSKGVGQ